MTYEPQREVIERYGRLLVEFGLEDGAGAQPGDVVLVIGSEDVKPLYVEVCRAVWRAGAHVIHAFMPEDDERFNLQKIFFEEASDEQLDFFPETYRRGLIDQVNKMVYVDGSRDPKAGSEIDPQKMMRQRAAMMPAAMWQMEKEREGNFHWTVGLYGTPAMAAEAHTSIEEYWDQIIHACYLDDPDPVARWKETLEAIHRYRDWLNTLPIERLHLEAEGTDLWMTLGEQRRWIGGTGRNIPSFEVFTSPDWRGTEGRVRFNEPLYAYGSLIKGIELEFKDGVVVNATADENEELIRQIVGAENADRVGEFSLTDASVSRINRFMASTLYDENMGGPYGNTHLAVGMSLTDAHDGDESTVSEEEWERLGYNLKTVVHTDIVSTTDRTVTALLKDGSEKVIYAGGHFQLD